MGYTIGSDSSRGTIAPSKNDYSESVPATFSIAELSDRFNQHTLGSYPSAHLEVPPPRKAACRLTGLIKQTSPPHKYHIWQQRHSTARRRSNPAFSSRLSAIVDDVLQEDHSGYITPHHSPLNDYSSNPTSSDDTELPPILSSPVVSGWLSSANPSIYPSESPIASDSSDLRSTTYMKTQRPYTNSKNPRLATFSEDQRGRYVVEKNIKMRRRGTRKVP